MALQDTWNKIKAVGLDVAESLTPVLKHSKFRETVSPHCNSNYMHSKSNANVMTYTKKILALQYLL